MQDEDDAIRRARLVLSLRQDGVTDRRLLAALERVPRAHFVPEAFVANAYDDRQLPIECGQTMESPRRLALLLARLDVGERDLVLEIGTGTGYATALLAATGRRVFSLERFRTHIESARARLKALRIPNAEIVHADGHAGWPASAPFERIFVSAAVPSVPDALFQQLAPGGTLLAPVGEGGEQTWIAFTRTRDDGIETDIVGPAFTASLGTGIARAL